MAESLLMLLENYSVDAIGARFPFESKRLANLGFQYLGVEMLVRGYNVYEGSYIGRVIFSCRGHSIIAGKGDNRAHHIVAPSQLSRSPPYISYSELEEIVGFPPRPLFVIDMGFLKIHTDEEKASLKIQIAMALTKVREYLWDRHLALTSISQGVEGWLYDVTGKNKMILAQERPGELLWSMKMDKVIILRPDADRDLSSTELLEADAFVIGGIVDKIPRPGLSRLLDMKVPWGQPRRISLRGSIIGVPARINRLVEILLRARLDFHGDLEKSIVYTMTRSDKVNRLFYEFTKKRDLIEGSDICEIYSLYRWLNPTLDDIRIALKKAKIDIKLLEPKECM